MESSLKFIQNRTVYLTFDASGRASAEVNVPFAVDRIVFRSLAYVGGSATYAVLESDMILWNAIGVVYRDSTFSNSAAQTNEFHFQTPTKVQGRYNFQLRDLSGAVVTTANTNTCVFVAEFIRDKDGKNGHM